MGSSYKRPLGSAEPISVVSINGFAQIDAYAQEMISVLRHSARAVVAKKRLGKPAD